MYCTERKMLSVDEEAICQANIGTGFWGVLIAVSECVKKAKRGNEKWSGKLTGFKNVGKHYVTCIQGGSGIPVLFVKTTGGAIACMPDFGTGCLMVNPQGLFGDTEQLVRVLGKIDGTAVASAYTPRPAKSGSSLLPSERIRLCRDAIRALVRIL